MHLKLPLQVWVSPKCVRNAKDLCNLKMEVGASQVVSDEEVCLYNMQLTLV